MTANVEILRAPAPLQQQVMPTMQVAEAGQVVVTGPALMGVHVAVQLAVVTI
jgi:hypothetical protein